MAERVFTVEISPTVADDGSTSTFLISQRPWTTSPTDTPSNRPVMGLLKNAGTVRRDLFQSARVTGPITPSYGNVVISNTAPVEGEPGLLDAWAGYGIAGSRIVVRWGEVGTAYPAAWEVVYIAYAQSMVADLGEITIRLRDKIQLLDKPAVTDPFFGTGGVEGTGGVARRKQLVTNDPGFVEPILVLVNEQVYFLQSTGDGGLRDAYSTVGSEIYPFAVFVNGIEIEREPNYSSEAELLSTEPSEGCVRFWFGEASTWDPSSRNGPVYFRLGSPAEGDVRVVAAGYPNDADHNRAGRAIGSFFAAHLALRAGMSASDMDDSSWGLSLDSQLVNDDRTYMQVLSDAALCISGWFGMSRLDKFRSGYLLDPESQDPYYNISEGVTTPRPDRPSTSLYTFREPQLQGFRREPVAGMEAPIWQVTVNAGDTWPSAIANGATRTMRDYLTREVWTTAQGVSTSALLANPGAQPASLRLRPRCIQNTFSARLFVERYLALYAGRREFFTFTVPMSAEVLALELHDVVTLQSSRYGLDAGRKFRIVGQTIDCASKVPSIRFTLWGGAAGQYTGGSGGPGSGTSGNSGTPAAAVERAGSSIEDFTGVAYGYTESSGGVSDGAADGDIGDFTGIAYGYAGGDPYFANTILLMHMEGADGGSSFIDSSTYGATLVVTGSATTSTDHVKAGSASYLGVASAKVDTPGHSRYSLQGDITIECWVYLLGTPNHERIFECGGMATLWFNGSTTTPTVIWPASVLFTATSAISIGQWVHLALVRSGSTVTLYIDGTAAGSGTSSFDDSVTARTITVGNFNSGTQAFKHHIDEFRVTKGIARYTANFTPPTGEFPDSA